MNNCSEITIMKTFTHPEGLFEVKIPLDWVYKNEIAGYDNNSPFSFELLDNNCGSFQISVYHKSEQKMNPTLPKHRYNSDKLRFVKSQLPDPEFKVLLWATVVEDFFFMAKYICQPNEENKNQIEQELLKVTQSLATLMCLSEDRRDFAIGFDRYEKFCVSLAASFDIKTKAYESLCFIQFIIICANHIDAYLRLCIVLKYQIIENNLLFKVEYLHQKENDKPMMEKKIYDKAKNMGIINSEQHDLLYKLYNLRNKVVHRYIITDIKTIELLNLGLKYETLSEEIRLILSEIEKEQFDKNVGYFQTRLPDKMEESSMVNQLYAMVNEKHFYSEYLREI